MANTLHCHFVCMYASYECDCGAHTNTKPYSQPQHSNENRKFTHSHIRAAHLADDIIILQYVYRRDVTDKFYCRKKNIQFRFHQFWNHHGFTRRVIFRSAYLLTQCFCLFFLIHTLFMLGFFHRRGFSVRFRKEWLISMAMASVGGEHQQFSLNCNHR